MDKKSEIARSDAYRLYSVCEALDGFITSVERESPERAADVAPLNDAIIVIMDVADRFARS